MGTDFDRMTHEEMLRWLDEAAGGEIQGAADRLVSAAKEIRRIAEDLKVRPQRVEWKGAGADAFRTWSADLANATLRLGEYSEGASKWLTEASNAIASAQTSIPRPESGARAGLVAALATRDDPAAPAGERRSAETLLASTEADRQEAVAQMRRLAQSYAFSASQLTGLEKPVFPPLPQEVVPDRAAGHDTDAGIGRTGVSAAGSASAMHAVLPMQRAGVDASGSTDAFAGSAGDRVSRAADSVARPVPADLDTRPVAMALDASAVLPDAPPIRAAPSAGLLGGPGLDGGTGPTGAPAPVVAGPPLAPSAAMGAGRTPAAALARLPGSGGPGGGGGVAPHRSASGVPAAGGGITGGRPVPQSSGRPAVGIPRGTVMGGEGGQGETPMARTPGPGAIGPMGTGAGVGAGRGGISGGRSLPLGGAGATRPFTSGGSGLPVSRGSRGGERDAAPDHLVEDEETWQYGDRRTVPPVVD